MDYLYFNYEEGTHGATDFGLADGEVLTSMVNLNGKIIVMSNRRTFLLKPKSRWQSFRERLARVWNGKR